MGINWIRDDLFTDRIRILALSRVFNGFPLHLSFSNLLANIIEVLFHQISIFIILCNIICISLIFVYFQVVLVKDFPKIILVTLNLLVDGISGVKRCNSG